MKVISMSLWGDIPMYCEGAIQNAQIRPFVYPGWALRIYHDDTVPEHVLDRLKGIDGVQLVKMPTGDGFKRLFWRMLVAGDETEAYIIRDSDCRFSVRESEAVRQWLTTDKMCHVMRDNKCHTLNVQGGMWGGRVRITNISEAIVNFCESAPTMPYKNHYFLDQVFLNDVVWPRIMLPSVMGHYRADCPQLKHSADDVPFTVDLDAGRFVGQVYDEFNRPLPDSRVNPLI